MEKLTAPLKTNLTDTDLRAFERIARMEGYDNASAYLRHLVHADLNEKRTSLQRLMEAFEVGEGSDGSGGSSQSKLQFLRSLIGID